MLPWKSVLTDGKERERVVWEGKSSRRNLPVSHVKLVLETHQSTFCLPKVEKIETENYWLLSQRRPSPPPLPLPPPQLPMEETP